MLGGSSKLPLLFSLCSWLGAHRAFDRVQTGAFRLFQTPREFLRSPILHASGIAPGALTALARAYEPPAAHSSLQGLSPLRHVRCACWVTIIVPHCNSRANPLDTPHSTGYHLSMRLLLRFGIPKADEVDASAQATADNFAEKQYWAPGYEVRRAKRFEYARNGQVFCMFEAWGEYDVKRLSAEVEKRLAEAEPLPEEFKS
jgi:hypothetical protein